MLKKQGKDLFKTAGTVCKGANIFYKTSVGSFGQPKTVFIWIPKTAGTSLFSALKKQIGMVNLCESISHVKAFKNRGAVTFGHYCYRSLLSAGIVSQTFHDSAYKFCVVRDPYDRSLSLYYYLRRKEGRCSQNFLQFLNDVYRNRSPVGMYNYLGLSQTNPQVNWIVDENGRYVVDKIYRFEDLEEVKHDFSTLFKIPDFDIGHENKVPRENSAEEIFTSHSEILPLIEEIYSPDFALLGYKKQIRGTQ